MGGGVSQKVLSSVMVMVAVGELFITTDCFVIAEQGGKKNQLLIIHFDKEPIQLEVSIQLLQIFTLRGPTHRHNKGYCDLLNESTRADSLKYNISYI